MSKASPANLQVWGLLLPADARAGRRPYGRREMALDHEGGLAAMQEAACQAASLTDATRTLIVLRAGQRTLLSGAWDSTSFPGRVVEQPADRGTAPELFLAASYIRAEDPDAILVTIPSDGLTVRQRAFQLHLQQAVSTVCAGEQSLVLLALSAHRPDADISWIEAGGPDDTVCNGILRPVRRYIERATRSEAERFFRRGLLADTKVMVSRVSSLWDVGLDLFPQMISRFEDLTDLLRLVIDRKVNPELEQLALRDVYRGLESLNLGRTIFNQALERLRVLPIRASGIGWGHASVEDTESEPAPAPSLAV